MRKKYAKLLMNVGNSLQAATQPDVPDPDNGREACANLVPQLAQKRPLSTLWLQLAQEFISPPALDTCFFFSLFDAIMAIQMARREWLCSGRAERRCHTPRIVPGFFHVAAGGEHD